jgi:hypothetical protein
MAKRDQDGPYLGPLEIRAGGLARTAVGLGVAAVPLVSLLIFKRGIGPSVATAGYALFAVLLVGEVVRYVRWRAKGCLVRLDAAGVTLSGGRVVGWDEIREVREVRRSRYADGLVFLPRDGAELPVFAITLFVLRPRTQAERMACIWGSPLVLSPRTLDVSRTQIVDAVRRFSGGVPILDERREIVVS